MDDSIEQGTFERAYAEGTPPWVIGQPQPAIVALQRQGWVRGSVLDAGCGTGEHTIHLARHGHEVLGVDVVPEALELARANAAAQDVVARFAVADMLKFDGHGFDTVIDSALFHVFGAEDRLRYTSTLHRICRAGAVVHVLALSDVGPGIGPRISDAVLREAFADGWTLEDLSPSTYLGFANADAATELGVDAGTVVEAPAWLARARRR